MMFSFKPAKPSQRTLIHEWLEQAHIKEWIHGVGLQNTLKGLEKFFHGEGDTTYWMGYDKDIPFAFLITSPEGKDATTLDLFICDLNYLGKGIAVSMIQQFLIGQFSNMKRVLIDPEVTNQRAIHVYQKAGFKITGEFIASWHPVPHYQMELKIEDLKVACHQVQMMKCTQDAEWEFAKKLRNKYFFDPLSITDPYVWTFNHNEHVHFILYRGLRMIGYAHIQLWPDQRAALRIFVIRLLAKLALLEKISNFCAGFL